MVNPGNLTPERRLPQRPGGIQRLDQQRYRDRPGGWARCHHDRPRGTMEDQEHSTAGHGSGERNEENT